MLLVKYYHSTPVLQFCVYEVESSEDGVSVSQVSFSFFPKVMLIVNTKFC